MGAVIQSRKIQAYDVDIDRFSRISAGDQNAMKEVYDLYSGPLYHFVKTWLSDSHEALDIVHETMLEVWRNADRYEGRSSAKSWIFSIARYKSIDKNRKTSRMVYTDTEPESVDESAGPFDQLSSLQESDILRDQINALSNDHKRVIYLAYYEGLSYREIAEIEGCPLGTIKTRVLHAKKILRRSLGAKRIKSY